MIKPPCDNTHRPCEHIDRVLDRLAVVLQTLLRRSVSLHAALGHRGRFDRCRTRVCRDSKRVLNPHTPVLSLVPAQRRAEQIEFGHYDRETQVMEPVTSRASGW